MERKIVSVSVIHDGEKFLSKGELTDPRGIQYLGIIAHDALRVMKMKGLESSRLIQAQSLIKEQLDEWGLEVGPEQNLNGDRKLWSPGG